MSENITVKIGEDRHEIRAAPMTVILPNFNVVEKIEVEKYVPIGMEESLYHIDRVKVFHKDLFSVVKIVFGERLLNDLHGPFNPDVIRQVGNGMKHVCGRFDLLLKLQDKGITAIHHRYPEAGLHPGVQGNLVDALLYVEHLQQLKQQQEMLKKLEAFDAANPIAVEPDPNANPLFPKVTK